MGGGFYALKTCLCQAWFMADLIKYMQEMLWVWSTVCTSRVTLWVALDTYLVLCTYRHSGTREFISAHFICLLLKLWLIVQKWLVFVSVVTGSHGWFLSSSYAKRQVSHLVSSTVQCRLYRYFWFTWSGSLISSVWCRQHGMQKWPYAQNKFLLGAVCFSVLFGWRSTLRRILIDI